jgi:hypothetical protein
LHLHYTTISKTVKELEKRNLYPKTWPLISWPLICTQLGIGEVRYQNYSEEYDKCYWLQRIVWALLDDDGGLEYELPSTEGLWNLLESIRRTLANVDNKIDHLIDAPDADEE